MDDEYKDVSLMEAKEKEEAVFTKNALNVNKKKYPIFQIVINEEIEKILEEEKKKLGIKSNSKLGLLMIEKYFKS